jgi:hypothetical protein
MKVCFFSVLLFFNFSIQAQTQGLYLDTVCIDQFSIDSTNTENFLWQIGNTSKSFFDNEWCLVTDTTNMYDSLTHAKVNLTMTQNQQCLFVLRFDHKIDTDLQHAGGYIEINIDNDSSSYSYNGQTYTTWNYIVNLDRYSHNYNYISDLGHQIYGNQIISPSFVAWGDQLTDYYYNSSIVYDTLFNGTPAFTGQLNDWETVEIWFLYTEPLKMNDIFDTLNVSFNFISDSLSNNKNGWALKNIQSGYGTLYGNVNEFNLTNEISVNPNPVNSTLQVKIDNPENKPVIIDVYSITGAKISSINKQGSLLQLDMSNYENGTYFLKYSIDNRYIGYSKVVKI